MTKADALLSDLAGRNPHERVRRAVKVARRLDAEKRRALLADLGRREPFCRQVAVTMAAATAESDHLVGALRDRYPSVRSRALAAPGLPDDALAAVVEDASHNDRLALYRRLRRRGPAELADGLLPVVRRRWGDAEAARLLAACSAAVVSGALPALGYAVRGWMSLTVRAPEAVIGYATAELDGLDTEARIAWWARNGQIQRALATHRPAALLDLCERFLTGPLPVAVSAHLGRLLAADPERVARLLLADPARPVQLAHRRLTRSVRDRLVALSDADLGSLLHASGPAPALVASLLHRLAPSRREAVFDRAQAGRDLAGQVLPDGVLALLPHARRQAEARRMLGLPAVATDTLARLRASAFLPLPEALAVLEPATRGAVAEERAHAYELLVSCVARTGDPAAVTRLLDGLNRIRNEQDPVRSRLLGALAGVRPELFGVAAIGSLDRLVRDALDARDGSWVTGDAVIQLVFRILWQSATSPETEPLMRWALETIERIAAWQRTPMTADLGRILRRGQERAVFDRMRPWLTEALKRNDAWPLLALARALDQRAWNLPDLQDLLARAARVKDDAVVAGAVSLWLRPPRGRAEKVGALVARDESTLTLPDVLSVVVRQRTDLIDAHVLAGRRLRGRFGTGKAWWLPTVPASTLASWTPDQVKRYAALVRRGVRDDRLTPWQRAALARTLPGLPGSGPETVADLIVSADVPIAEGALTGLAQCDRPDEALAVLLEHLEGDRARVAVFAASRCAYDVEPSRLAAILDGALARAPKVTVRKEAARLMSAMRVPGAADSLVGAWHRGDQHRDVRVAVAAALRAWLDHPAAWAVLEDATAGDRPVAESLLGADPHRLAPGDRQRYAELVRRLTHHSDHDVARRAYADLAAWTPWAPGSVAEIGAGLTDLAPGSTWRYAAGCAVTPGVWSALPDLLPEVTATLLRLAGSDPDAEALRDLPARQRLRHVVESLCRWGQAARRHPDPVRRMVDILRAEPTFVTEAVRLSACLLWPGPDFADDLVALADLLAVLPVAASEVDGYWGLALWEPADVAPAADALAARGDAAGGLLAVALTRVAGQRAGWPEQWRRRLRALRGHGAPEVRHAALGVVTATE